MVALDADTGTLRWHYQFTPHDVYDYDSVQVPVLVDNWGSTGINAIAWANRNGNLLRARSRDGTVPARQAVREGQLDERVRRAGPADTDAAAAGQPTYPGNQGGTNWYSPSFSPRTGLFYVSAWEDYASIYGPAPVEYKEGRNFTGGGPRPSRRCRARPVSAVRRSTPGPKPPATAR